MDLTLMGAASAIREALGGRRGRAHGGDTRAARGRHGRDVMARMAWLRSHPMTAPEELQAQADAIGWYHTIDLGNGVVTKGNGVQLTGAEILPDVTGRSVLDVGAWDGKFSFLAEQAGASRVVALDHYAWGVDFVARGAYWAECIQNGTLPDQSRDETDFWLPDLPGRRGFEFAAAVLGSKVEPVVADFQTVDLDELGQFDVVLYLGVLYHMKEPLTCLERVRAVTKEVAVVETEAVHIQGFDDEVLLQFHAGSSLRTDFGNWYVPTIQALHNLCRAAGFSAVQTVVGPPAPVPEAPPGRRLTVARRLGAIPAPRPSAPSQNYRAIVHAYP
jgi:tRNA (mo5U34)-methyltransferase